MRLFFVDTGVNKREVVGSGVEENGGIIGEMWCELSAVREQVRRSFRTNWSWQE